MRLSRRAVSLGVALATLALSWPLWVFELFVQVGVFGEDLTLPSGPPVPRLMQEAMWVAIGETPGSGVEALWAGHSSLRAPGSLAASLVAREMVYRSHERRLRMLEHHFRETAVVVWLSRHVSEAELKRAVAQSSSFGRGARGASDAARVYFGKPLEELTLGQIATLAGLPRSPPSLDPACHPERTAKRRTFVLERLWRSGVVTSAEALRANQEALVVAAVCSPGPPAGAMEEDSAD